MAWGCRVFSMTQFHHWWACSSVYKMLPLFSVRDQEQREIQRCLVHTCATSSTCASFLATKDITTNSLRLPPARQPWNAAAKIETQTMKTKWWKMKSPYNSQRKPWWLWHNMNPEANGQTSKIQLFKRSQQFKLKHTKMYRVIETSWHLLVDPFFPVR